MPLLARAGHAGGPADHHPGDGTPRFRMLNADVVLRAYYAAGLGHPGQAGAGRSASAAPMSRDGDGSRVVVDLPYGKGLDDALKAKPAIASGLDVTVSQVFIHRDPHVAPAARPVGRRP